MLLPNGERYESCFIAPCEIKTYHKGATQFRITSSYDKHLLFKGSAAYAAMEHVVNQSKIFNLINFQRQKNTVTNIKSIPKSNSKFQVLHLKVLASVQVFLNRANDIDFGFMQLKVNDVKAPEYNGYNKILREAGKKLQAGTYLIYFSLINMSSTAPDAYGKDLNNNTYGKDSN